MKEFKINIVGKGNRQQMVNSLLSVAHKILTTNDDKIIVNRLKINNNILSCELSITDNKKSEQEKFALAMSNLLFELRTMRGNGQKLLYDMDVPINFIKQIINDVNHIPTIKKLIYDAVIEGIENNDKLYHINNKGVYSYIPNTYKYSYVIDSYIIRLYENQMIEEFAEKNGIFFVTIG